MLSAAGAQRGGHEQQRAREWASLLHPIAKMEASRRRRRGYRRAPTTWLPGCLVLILVLSVEATDIKGARFVSEPSYLVEFSNTTGATIPCTADGIPPPTISWVLVDGSLVGSVPGLRQVTSEGSLVFPPFKAEDYRQDVHAVVYRCIASNPAGVVISKQVHVKAVMNPVYDLQVYDSYAIKGSSAVLRCSVPSFLANVVNVTAWIRDSAFKIESSPSQDGKYAILPRGELYIRDVDHNDGGTSYRCQVRHRFTGEVRQSSTAGTLYVTEPEGNVAPKIKDMVSKVSSIEGETVILPCAAQGYPLPEYSWYLKSRDGELISVYLGERLIQISSVLVIQKVMVSDSGVYVCKAENSVGQDQAEMELNVSAPLSVSVTPERHILEIGRSLKLRCSVTGTPVLGIAWVKDGRPLTTDTHLLVDNDVIHIDYSRPEHKGLYQCFAHNDKDMAQATAELVMGDRVPHLLEGFGENTLKPGESVVMTCAFKGSPVPGVAWLLDNTPLPESHRYTMEAQTDGIEKIVNSLRVDGVKAEDGGRYTCEASNKAGKTTHSARLNIHGRPSVRNMGKVSVIAGENASLNCAYYGYPIDKITWKKGSTELPVNMRQDVLPNGTLVINNVQRASDSGRYTCVASNKDGDSASQGLELAVLVAPSIIPFSFQGDRLFEGVIARISCVVYQGDLPIQLHWLKDGQSLPEELGVEVKTIDDYSTILTIPEVKPAHAGDYTCVAKNMAATANYSASLVVNVPPYWTVEPNDTSSFLGGSVQLHCLAGGFPAPTIAWFKVQGTFPRGKKKKLDQSEDYQILSNGTLFIQHVDDPHNGYYFCEAQNGIGQGVSKVVRLVVHRPPKFGNPLQRRTIPKGDPLKLECEPKGDRPIQVTWIVNGNKVHRKDPRYKLRETHSDEKFASELSIDSTERTDSGNFTCAARNVYGSADAIFEVLILEPPDAPQDVKLLEAVNRTMTFSWVTPFTGNTVLKRYIVQYKESDVSWLEGGKNMSVDPQHNRVTITGLKPATQYNLRVFALNDRGVSPPSQLMSVTMVEEAPSAPPEGIEVEASDGTTVKVFWKPPKKEHWNGNIKGYYVGYRVAGTNEEYTLSLLDVPDGYTDRLSLTLTELQKFIQYAVVVQAFNSEGKSPISEEVIIMTSEAVPSSPPREVRCNVLNSHSLHVTWQPPPDDTVNGILRGYRVYYLAMDDGFTGPSLAENKAVTTPKVTLHDLRKFANYSIQVAAYTKKGDGIKSEPVFCTTLEDVPDPPAAIKALPSSPDSVLLTWKPPPQRNGVITKYTVYAKNVDDETEEKTIHVAKGEITTQEVSGLKSGSRYKFWVTASTSIGEGQKSKIVTESSGDETVPAKSASFNEVIATAVKSTLNLPCKAVGIPPPDRKWARRGKDIDKSDRLYVMPDGSLTITNIQEKDAGNYTCKISNGYGEDQVVYTVVVLAPPGKPVMEVTLATTTTLDVQWKLDTKGGSPILGYILHYKREFGTWETIDIGPKLDTYRLYELWCGTVYHLYILAYNKVGHGEPSNNIKASTKGSPPEKPNKTDLLEESSTSLTIKLDSWKSASCPIQNFVTEYRVQKHTTWALLSDEIKPDQRRLVIQNLTPATWYALRMTAHNNAGLTIAEYDFATLTLAGGTISPEEMVNDDLQVANVFNLFDLEIVIPAACFLFIFIVALIIVCICAFCARRSSKQKHRAAKAEPDIKPTTEEVKSNNHHRHQKRTKKEDVYVDTGFTYFQRNQPNNNGRPKQASSRGHGHQRHSRLPREYKSEDDLTPYATIHLNGSTSLDLASFGRRASGSSSHSVAAAAAGVGGGANNGGVGGKRQTLTQLPPGGRHYSGSLGNISYGSRIQQVPTAPPMSDTYGAAVLSVYPRLSSSLNQCSVITPVPARRNFMQPESVQKQELPIEHVRARIFTNPVAESTCIRPEPRPRAGASTKPACMSGAQSKSAFS